MATDLAKKVKELMRKPEQIRNIAICAHIDHGKCISGDSKLQLTDGSIVKAKEIFEIAERKGKKFDEKDRRRFFIITNRQRICKISNRIF